MYSQSTTGNITGIFDMSGGAGEITTDSVVDGDMFANLININDLNVIDTFIRDYNLKQ